MASYKNRTAKLTELGDTSPCQKVTPSLFCCGIVDWSSIGHLCAAAFGFQYVVAVGVDPLMNNECWSRTRLLNLVMVENANSFECCDLQTIESNLFVVVIETILPGGGFEPS